VSYPVTAVDMLHLSHLTGQIHRLTHHIEDTLKVVSVVPTQPFLERCSGAVVVVAVGPIPRAGSAQPWASGPAGAMHDLEVKV
jgi:hypothetical protein